jgi:Flp pilus assembly pilin Flp
MSLSKRRTAPKGRLTMQQIRNYLRKLRGDQRGLTTVEYAIILCVIVAISVATWDNFGGAVEERLGEDTKAISGALKPGTK